MYTAGVRCVGGFIFFIITTKKCSKYLHNTKICSTFVVS